MGFGKAWHALAHNHNKLGMKFNLATGKGWVGMRINSGSWNDITSSICLHSFLLILVSCWSVQPPTQPRLWFHVFVRKPEIEYEMKLSVHGKSPRKTSLNLACLVLKRRIASSANETTSFKYSWLGYGISYFYSSRGIPFRPNEWQRRAASRYLRAVFPGACLCLATMNSLFLGRKSAR